MSDEIHIYSPLSPELISHLSALNRFNSRTTNPTHWSVHLIAGDDYLTEFQHEEPGNIVALSGRNDKKISYVLAALKAGQNVFADKPWIITTDAMPALESALVLGDLKHLVTYDWMTLRGDIAYQIERDLIGDRSVFGEPAPGTQEHPAVRLENLHALLKFVNGAPQQRPASFLDVRQQGEGMADVGTHLVDLVQWSLFPDQAISYRKDIRILEAEHSPLMLSLQQFDTLTGQTTWPAYLKTDLVNNELRYFANGSCDYTIRGVHVQIKVGWQFEAPPGAQDSYFTSFLGTRARLELRAGAKEHYKPEVYVTPTPVDRASRLEADLTNAVSSLQGKYPGLSVEKVGHSFHMLIPTLKHNGDDLHMLFQTFTGFVHDYQTFPRFENSNLLAKYYVTTTAVALAQKHSLEGSK